MLQRETNGSKNSQVYSVFQMSMLVILRIAIGWHFLYEGISKLFTPNWSSAGYLVVSKWIFSGFFHWIASTPAVLIVVDFLNIWGLILIGLGLMFGCFTRVASIAGIVLLLFYYVANPPFIGMDFGVMTEGNYLFVDKNLVELIALMVLALFPADTLFSLDRLIIKLKGTRKKSILMDKNANDVRETPMPNIKLDRRELLKNLISLPVFGAFIFAVLKKRGWESYEEKFLKEVDAVTSATIKTFNFQV